MNNLRLSKALLAALLMVQGAHAAATGNFSVSYDGLSHGLLALKLDGALTLTPSGYAGEIRYHTAGMIGWMVRNEDDSHVSGLFVGDTAVPQHFDSVGNLRGTERITRMRYVNGVPEIEARTPPVELERAPVPADQTAHTIDTLSAIALLIRQAGQTGRCDGHARLFDGRRLTDLNATTVGDETLARTSRSIWSGQALRCDFTGDQIAGFKRDESEEEQRKTKHGSAWLAQAVPGGPLVPVKVVFENKALGLVTLYLRAVSGSPGPVAERLTPGRVR